MLNLAVLGLEPSRRSVCTRRVLEVGVRLRAEAWGWHYVRANSLKCELGHLRIGGLKRVSLLRFFSRFEKK
jgi:hypothetical protein